MTGIPSWAVKGAKCVCVRTQPPERRVVGAVYPLVGEVYTIRKVVICTIGMRSGLPSLLLEEITNDTSINPLVIGVESSLEAAMPIDAFRPLVTRTQEQDIAEHFSGFLHQTRRVPESADA